ncbi:MAG: decaprenyl-phosphate phosphoribosyltransferase [Patescibacteria group bacterium]|nr:MAG: decaprenyl-phosphate phosphoribosyltransferase [Patescibacteria group bacterium]
MRKILIYIEACRYNQWIKNLVVFTAPLFTGHLFETQTILVCFFSFLVMSLASSASYLLNDILDYQSDLKHPQKRLRPIARGDLAVHEAVFIMFVTTLVVLIISIFYSLAFFVVVLIFLLLHFLYSLYFKQKTLLDIFTISFSFILRALAGEVATGYHIPIWLLMTIFFISLFMASVKRHAELVRHGSSTRKVLEKYPEHLLTFLTNTFATTTIISYAFYTYFENAPIVQTPLTRFFSHYLPAFELRRWMMITIPFVVMGIARYAQLLYSFEEGERPEKIIVTDKFIIVVVFLWALIIVSLIYVFQQ